MIGDRAYRPPGIVGFDVEKFAVGDLEFTTRAAADNHLAQLAAEREAQATSGGFEYEGFKATPGYEFRVDEGQKAIDRAFAARGGFDSGAALKATARFNQDIASAEYGNYLNRLAAMAGQGQVATQQAFQGYQNQGNALANYALQGGNARASSYVGQATP